MTEIRNTTADMQGGDSLDRLLLLATSMATGSPTEFIEAQESAGQRQLVNSDRLPTKVIGCTEADLEALGLTLGEPDPDDPMFRAATLPDGWKRQRTEHSMWSEIVDQHGRPRIACFYKAAFYDRSAHASVNGLGAYVRSCVYDGKPVITDETWATHAAVHQALLDAAADARERVASWTEIRGRKDQRPGTVETADKYIAEYAAEAEKYEAIAEQYAGGESHD